MLNGKRFSKYVYCSYAVIKFVAQMRADLMLCCFEFYVLHILCSPEPKDFELFLKVLKSFISMYTIISLIFYLFSIYSFYHNWFKIRHDIIFEDM